MFSHDFPIWMRDDQYFYRGLIAIHLLSAPGCWDSQSARTWACWRTTPADWSLYMAVWTGFSVDVPTWLKFNHIESYMLFHVIHIICVYIYILYIYIYISLFILRFLTCLAQVVHSVASCLYIETISLIPATPWSWRLFRALKLVTKRPWHKPLFAGTCSLYSTVYTSNYENTDSIDVWKSEVWLLNFLR